MEIHKPKAVHGWREFVGEVGIIVIGVLIALAAEQTVEALRWRHETAAAREALSVEFAGDIGFAEERARLAPCFARRIQDIAAILDAAGESGRLPPVALVGGPPERDWNIWSWNSALASQAAAHLPRDELLAYAQLAGYGQQLTGQNEDELAVWAELNAISGPGRRIDLAEIGRLRSALSRAHLLTKLMTGNSEQLTRWIRQHGIAQKAQWRDDPPGPDGARPICRPLGAAPSTYGQAPQTYELPGWRP